MPTNPWLEDRASPLKPYTPDYSAIEDVAERDLRARFGLPERITEGCKKVGLHRPVSLRRIFLIKSKGEGWVDRLKRARRTLSSSSRGDGWRVTGMGPVPGQETPF